MILCLASVHASIFKTMPQAFFVLLNTWSFVSVCVIRKFYQQTILAIVYLILLLTVYSENYAQSIVWLCVKSFIFKKGHLKKFKEEIFFSEKSIKIQQFCKDHSPLKR